VYIRGFTLIDFFEPALEQEGRGDRGEFAGFLIRAIGEIRGSSSLRSEQPLAVTPAAWSAAGGRGFMSSTSHTTRIAAASETRHASSRVPDFHLLPRPGLFPPA
jgi:hypothetical protein